MIINLNKSCKNLMYSDFEDKTILSFELDTQQIKNKLKELNFEKIYNFKENINFLIEIDSSKNFDSINLKTFEFKDLINYTGNIVYSCIIKICERQLNEKAIFYYRVKIKKEEKQYNIKSSNIQGYYNFEFEDQWSDYCEINIKKNYTMDIISSMYNFIADYNAYNKEVKSANFYYFLLPHAKELNNIFYFILNTRDSILLNKCESNHLDEIFGNKFGFNIPFNINTEEFRRILINLQKAFLNSGTYYNINEVIKYFFGEYAEFKDYTKIYPWILRSNKRKIEDLKNPSYINYKSNYYLYNLERKYNKQKNEIMLLSKNFNKFNFEIKIDNFFNVDFILKDVKKIINLLKPIYTKYIIKISEKESFNPPPYSYPLLINDEQILKNDDNSYIRYK